jgi:membrane-associated phospholipid phosphatase
MLRFKRVPGNRFSTSLPLTLAAFPWLLIAGTAAAQTDDVASARQDLGRAGLTATDSLALPSVFSPNAAQALRLPLRLPATASNQTEETKWTQTPTFKSTIAAASLITLGLFAFKDEGFLNRKDIREWRNTFIPEFEDHSDDYTQFTAGFLALGLNAAGVKGKHNFLRASATYGGGLGLMFVSVHTIKNLSEVERPDGSSRNSFPSGHTAASFASARFLDKEYGDVHYLYSLGGYGAAVYTGVFRQLNNRHWNADVLVGAGIGLLSVDIAYILMDDIFGDKGKNAPRPPKPEGPRGSPSFLDFRLGYAWQVGDLADRKELFSADDGWSAGFEGAYFFNDYIGVGGELSVAAFTINNENYVPEDSTIFDVADDLITQPFGAQSTFIGPFFNLPLGDRWALNAKATAGWSAGATATLNAVLKEEFREEFGVDEVPVAVFDPKGTYGLAAGLSLRGMVSKRIGVRIFGEYNYSSPDYEISSVVSVDEGGNVLVGPVEEVVNVDFSYLSVGASVSAMVW